MEFCFSEEDLTGYSYEYLKALRGETLETDGHLLIVRNSSIGTFHLPRSDEDAQDNSNVNSSIQNCRLNERTLLLFRLSKPLAQSVLHKSPLNIVMSYRLCHSQYRNNTNYSIINQLIQHLFDMIMQRINFLEHYVLVLKMN